MFVQYISVIARHFLLYSGRKEENLEDGSYQLQAGDQRGGGGHHSCIAIAFHSLVIVDLATGKVIPLNSLTLASSK